MGAAALRSRAAALRSIRRVAFLTVTKTDFVDLLHYCFYGGKCDFILAREECDKENDASHYPDNINV